MLFQASRRLRKRSPLHGKQVSHTLYRDLKWAWHGYHAAKNDRFVFCRPIGGFNDNLAQISRCMTYCMLYKRRLVLSMTNAGQLRSFADFFAPHPSSSSSILLADSMHGITESRDVFPTGLHEEFENIYPIWDAKSKAHIDPVSGTKICFEDREYNQAILFHAQCGGGAGWSALERFQLTPLAWHSIQERLQNLPRHYNAIHIRNSEHYRTDWKTFLNKIPTQQLHELPCLLCTDDPSIAEAAREIYTSVEFLSIYQFPPDLDQGESLHYSPKSRGWSFDIGMLADLLGMARAERLFIASHRSNSFSGFSLLARDLQRRPHLLRRLIPRCP
jgi:hypothetical protein